MVRHNGDDLKDVQNEEEFKNKGIDGRLEDNMVNSQNNVEN